ncbi:hypothetical protein SAMN05660826_01249 [Caldanaerovirga acetigignens]|uniref:YqeG family HAD IIIA-type phosphatase n=1 Tax=Caldanaerovirga acetigignens TaxID=447595 RepID=A0A1M7JGC6_9FIRM|nr:YqeG family HAD IIIA-type phosphatase [Caldanaerovirga acetigignens]SHM52119.1 hypothetical protein SAMN05660826_01249 [Caldanaerovirga acetigignens]
MLNLFLPDFYVTDIFEIDFDYLKKNNIKAILVDLDNTLVPWNSSEVNDKLIKWIEEGKEKGFKFCIVSNNLARRIIEFSKKLGIPAVTGAFKPGKKIFLKGLEVTGTTAKETAFVGDQLFTDVLGAKRMGMKVILVKPISEKEFFWTRIIRLFEKKIIDFMEKKGLLTKF